MKKQPRYREIVGQPLLKQVKPTSKAAGGLHRLTGQVKRSTPFISALGQALGSD
jgi:hypothetical protein